MKAVESLTQGRVFVEQGRQRSLQISRELRCNGVAHRVASVERVHLGHTPETTHKYVLVLPCWGTVEKATAHYCSVAFI